MVESLKRKYGLDREGAIPSTFNPLVIPADMFIKNGKIYVLGKSIVGNFDPHVFPAYLLKLDRNGNVISGKAFWRVLGEGSKLISRDSSLFVVGTRYGFPIVYRFSENLEPEWEYMYFPSRIEDVVIKNGKPWVVLVSYYPRSHYIISYSANGTTEDVFRLPLLSDRKFTSDGNELYVFDYGDSSILVLPRNDSYVIPNESGTALPSSPSDSSTLLIPLEKGILVKSRNSRSLYYVLPNGSGYTIKYSPAYLNFRSGSYNAGKTALWDYSQVVFLALEGDEIKVMGALKLNNGRLFHVVPGEEGFYALVGDSTSTCLASVGFDGNIKWSWRIPVLFPYYLRLYGIADGKLILGYMLDTNTTIMGFTLTGSYIGSAEIPGASPQELKLISVNGTRITLFSSSEIKDVELRIEATNTSPQSCKDFSWGEVRPPIITTNEITYPKRPSNVSRIDSVENLYRFDLSKTIKLEGLKKIQDVKSIEPDNTTYVLINDWRPEVTSVRPTAEKTDIRLLPTETVEIETVYTNTGEPPKSKDKGGICGPGSAVLLAVAVLLLKRR